MTNPYFIELLTILEERGWEYEITLNGMFYILLGNQEFEFDKTDRLKTIEMTHIVENW